MRSVLFLRCIWAVMEPLLTSGVAAAAAASAAMDCRPSPAGEYCSRSPGGEPPCCAAAPSAAAERAASGTGASCGAAAAAPSAGCTREPVPGLPSWPSALDNFRIILLLSGAGQGLQGEEGGGCGSIVASGCRPAAAWRARVPGGLGSRSGASISNLRAFGARLRPGSRMEGGDTAASVRHQLNAFDSRRWSHPRVPGDVGLQIHTLARSPRPCKARLGGLGALYCGGVLPRAPCALPCSPSLLKRSVFVLVSFKHRQAAYQ